MSTPAARTPRRGFRRLVVGTAVVLLSSAATSLLTPAAAAPSGSSTTPALQAGTPSNAAISNRRTSRATFGIAPATPTRVDNRTEFGYVLAPTAHYDDYAAVRNFSTKPLRLSIAAVDLGNDPSGNVEAGLSQAAARDAGRWISVNHASTFVVPPQTTKGPGQVIVPFRIVVPTNASVGDHAAEILATLTTISRGKNKQNVLLNQRIGTRIFVRVPGNPQAALKIRNLSLHFSGGWAYPFGSGRLQVRYTLVNTGNVTLNVKQRASVSGWFGASVHVPGKQTPPVPVLLPGQTAAMNFTVTGVPRAVIDHFSITATATYGTDTTLDQAQPTELASLAPVSAVDDFWAVPWLVIVAVVLLLVLVGWMWWRRRQRHRRPPPPGSKHRAKQLQPIR